MLFEAGVKILIILCLLSSFQEFFGGFGLLGGGSSIHDTYVVNTDCPLCSEVSDEDNPLQLSFIL